MSEQETEDQTLQNPAAKNTISADLLYPLINDLESSSLLILESSSEEGTHLIRVTLRKIRAWVGLCKTQLSEEQTNNIRNHVRWISALTSPARDADVQLAKNVSANTKLPEMAETKLKQQQTETYSNIRLALQSDRFSEFKALLTSIATSIAPNDTLSSEDINTRVLKLTKKSLRLGDALNVGSSDEEFHIVRKRLKKLRYTLGFQMQISPDRKLAKTEKSLKQIQDYLGDFQDQTVLVKELDLRAEELLKAGKDERQELFELGVSIGEKRAEVQALKAGFPKAYGKFTKAITKYLFND